MALTCRPILHSTQRGPGRARHELQHQGDRMNESQFVDWLELFGRSWKGNDPADIGALVPDKCAWHAGPFAEVFRDRQTLVDHWVSSVRPESNVEVGCEILSVT